MSEVGRADCRVRRPPRPPWLEAWSGRSQDQREGTMRVTCALRHISEGIQESDQAEGPSETHRRTYAELSGRLAQPPPKLGLCAVQNKLSAWCARR